MAHCVVEMTMKCIYICVYMVIIVGCSTLLIGTCLFDKLSVVELRESTYRFSVYHDD